MSNEFRIPDQVITVKAPRFQGKIQHELIPAMKIKLYGAYQFRKNHNRLNRNFHPPVPIKYDQKELWYSSMYRLKIDGTWYRPGNAKYQFFTVAEVLKLILSFGG